MYEKNIKTNLLDEVRKVKAYATQDLAHGVIGFARESCGLLNSGCKHRVNDTQAETFCFL